MLTGRQLQIHTTQSLWKKNLKEEMMTNDDDEDVVKKQLATITKKSFYYNTSKSCMIHLMKTRYVVFCLIGNGIFIELLKWPATLSTKTIIYIYPQ